MNSSRPISQQPPSIPRVVALGESAPSDPDRCSWGHILAKFCYVSKQHFASSFANTAEVEKNTASQVVADNLKSLMKEKGWSQPALAEKSSVAQRSISNLLRPTERAASKSGKAPSPTVAQVEAVARAFDLEAWQLLCPMSGDKWKIYMAAERMYKDLLAPAEVAPEAGGPIGKQAA